MAIIMVYHELVSRESADVSRAWKWHILCLLGLIVAVAIVDIFIIHMLSVSFNYKCIVGAKLRFNVSRLRRMHSNEPASSDDMLIVESQSQWGEAADCDHIRFVPVLMATCASVWFVVFSMCGHGGRGKDA